MRSSATAQTLQGRIVIALTANPFYSLSGVKPGDSLAKAGSILRLSKPIRVGVNTWCRCEDS